MSATLEPERVKEPKAKIFIIDDSPTAVMFARLILEEEGYLVSTFESPLGISREIARQRPDLVLLDVNMPSITGDKICKLIRSIPGGQEAKVLLYSSKWAGELQKLVDECGADGFVPKSTERKVIVGAVKEQLSRAKSASGLFRRIR